MYSKKKKTNNSNQLPDLQNFNYRLQSHLYIWNCRPPVNRQTCFRREHSPKSPLQPLTHFIKKICSDQFMHEASIRICLLAISLQCRCDLVNHLLRLKNAENCKQVNENREITTNVLHKTKLFIKIPLSMPQEFYPKLLEEFELRK